MSTKKIFDVIIIDDPYEPVKNGLKYSTWLVDSTISKPLKAGSTCLIVYGGRVKL